MKRLAAAVVIATQMGSPASASWNVRVATSNVDGQQTLTLSTIADTATIVIVCSGSGRVASVSYGTRISLFGYGATTGSFRFDGSSSPVTSIWRGEGDDAILLDPRATASLVRGLSQASRLHLRVNGAERTISYQRLPASAEINRMCRLTTDRSPQRPQRGAPLSISP